MPRRLSAHERGKAGEDRAVAYLSAKGYKILDRNFRTRGGEVDIVCETEREIVFVEVKSWRSLDQEALAHAIDRRKQRRIVSVARMYLCSVRPVSPEMSVRFDVVFVSTDSGSVHHIRGAFDSEWPE